MSLRPFLAPWLTPLLIPLFIPVLIAALTSGCVSNGNNSEDLNEGFALENLAKTDINMVLDRHVEMQEEYLQQLMLKLYKRNPAYWRNTGAVSAQARVEQYLSRSEADLSKELANRQGTAVISLAFLPEFGGDRVLAFVFGIDSMLHDARGGRDEFYLLDQLDPQKLYNAARNIEVAVWKLSNDRQPDGSLYLHSNAVTDEVRNLSFERLFGKLIALQDSNAQIVANSTNRLIKDVIHGMASMVFLPI